MSAFSSSTSEQTGIDTRSAIEKKAFADGRRISTATMPGIFAWGMVTGMAMVPPRGRGDVDVSGFLPFVIQLEGRDPEGGLPRRWPPPVFDNGPHLSYAIQWFSFALIALVGTAVMIRKGR